jgi:ATP-dependent Lhr-like helicase
VAIDQLYRAHATGTDIAGATRVVYVSPLKALAVDIAQNLERPLQEIGVVARELGFEPAPISVAVRTGDTSQAQRTQMLRQRPSLVVTTLVSPHLQPPARADLTHATVETVTSTKSTRLRATSAVRAWCSVERLEAQSDSPGADSPGAPAPAEIVGSAGRRIVRR